uniref:Uncharacterized protein n=1 Tax=Panagrolaimus sp. PS1159 TaxID=55785 RepID=A0AC35G7D6_9BILA
MILPPFGKIYRLPYAKRIWSFCDVLMKQTNENFAFDFLKQYLVFPHDQLYRFYRFMQINSAKRMLDDVSTKEKYDAAIKSYNYMISIAMDSEKWLEWMKETFEEKDWALNLECKISEHFFMKEIWFFYIEFLDSTNKVKVLDVYKRYCRLFIEDKDMQMQYSEAIKKYDGKFHVFRWECDLEEFQWDFETKENGCPKLQNLLEKVPDCICKNCFGQKNAKYFDNKLKVKKDKSILSKIFKNKNKKKRDPKIKNCLLCYDLLDKKDDMDLSDEEGENDGDKKSKKRCTEYRKAINFQHVVKINFSYRNGLNLPLPKPIFDYIVQNANEKILSKFYECSKYFFVKRMHLLCGSIYVGTFEPEFIKTLYYTTVEGLTNLQVKKLCCGTNFVFFDRSTRTSLTPLIPKLCFCSLVNVALVNQDLTIVEFDLIIGGGNLEQIDIDKTAIINDDGSYLTVEEIFEKLPNVAVFSLNPISPSMFTPSTTEKLSQIDRTTKFEHFEIWSIPNTFELTSFMMFMERNMVPRATMLLMLTPEIDDNYENINAKVLQF